MKKSPQIILLTGTWIMCLLRQIGSGATMSYPVGFRPKLKHENLDFCQSFKLNTNVKRISPLLLQGRPPSFKPPIDVVYLSAINYGVSRLKIQRMISWFDKSLFGFKRIKKHLGKVSKKHCQFLDEQSQCVLWQNYIQIQTLGTS